MNSMDYLNLIDICYYIAADSIIISGDKVTGNMTEIKQFLHTVVCGVISSSGRMSKAWLIQQDNSLVYEMGVALNQVNELYKDCEECNSPDCPDNSPCNGKDFWKTIKSYKRLVDLDDCDDIVAFIKEVEDVFNHEENSDIKKNEVQYE